MDRELDLVPSHECEEGRCRDMFWEFIYIIVIPWGTVWLLVFIVSIILCCGSCKRKKRSAIIDEAQLMKYNSIRRASVTLRNLSHNRDTPLLPSQDDRSDRDARTASLNLERDHRYRRGMRGTASAPGTLRREHREARANLTASTLSASVSNEERLVN